MKTGGRQKGTPNRRTQQLIERLEELDVDPVEGLAQIVKEPDCTPETRRAIYLELLQYLFPKRKAVEHAALNGGIQIVLSPTEMAL
jgi:hypothetical protein